MATPVHFTIEGHFAPFVRLTITTLALAVGAMFMVATTRTAAAFAEPHSYLGRFINREFFADYSPVAGRPTHVLSVTLDPVNGPDSAETRTIEVGEFIELRAEILNAVEADAAAQPEPARRGPAAGSSEADIDLTRRDTAATSPRRTRG